MKICFIAPANSSHTEKWCKWFSGRGHEVHVLSFTDAAIEGTQVHYIPAVSDTQSASDLAKLNYLLHGGEIRRLLRTIDPDVVNAHYATSYGTAAALAGVKGYVCSVWGSDVYEFPRKSPVHRWMLEYSLKRAGYLFSTSHAMAAEAAKYTNKRFDITPFGVDMDLFSPDKRRREEDDDSFIVGTVKGLKQIYGIDYLLKAVSVVRREHPEIPIKLRIAGKGEQEAELKQLARDLGIDDITTWLGYISQEQAAREWADMDLAAVVSSGMESFGVSAVEAQACETPVIVSDVPGLMEATSPGKTSVVVPRMDENALAEAIVGLYAAPKQRRQMGQEGRKFVQEHYELERCFLDVEALFRSVAEENRKRRV